jgi:hypothetical protein
MSAAAWTISVIAILIVFVVVIRVEITSRRRRD